MASLYQSQSDMQHVMNAVGLLGDNTSYGGSVLIVD